MNQFFYTRSEQINGPNGESELKDYQDSFNINKIIRSVTLGDGRLLILLDDIHQRLEEKPKINTKINKVVGTIKEIGTFQTEIFLQGNDKERFYKLTNIEV